MEWDRHWDELFRHEEWNVGFVASPIHAFLDPGFRPRVRWLRPRAETFLADPFAIPGEPGAIACEEWDARTDRGRLIGIDRGGERHVLQGFPLDLHLSYPFLVREAGETYCVPEMWQSGGVHLYRRTGRWQWEHEAEILSGFAGVDATVFRHDGRWWLACMHQYADSEADLYLFWAEKLHGPWRPHRANPVKRDRGSARPGGTPFRHEGKLYRPAQDCRRGYGSGLAINRVDRLDPESFAETTVVRWAPLPGWRWSRGWHTLSAMGRREEAAAEPGLPASEPPGAGGEGTLLDARRDCFMPSAFRRVARRKLARLGARRASPHPVEPLPAGSESWRAERR